MVFVLIFSYKFRHHTLHNIILNELDVGVVTRRFSACLEDTVYRHNNLMLDRPNGAIQHYIRGGRTYKFRTSNSVPKQSALKFDDEIR